MGLSFLRKVNFTDLIHHYFCAICYSIFPSSQFQLLHLFSYVKPMPMTQVFLFFFFFKSRRKEHSCRFPLDRLLHCAARPPGLLYLSPSTPTTTRKNINSRLIYNAKNSCSCRFSHLPDSDCSIGNKNEKNDKWFYKCCYCFCLVFVFFKKSKDLKFYELLIERRPNFQFLTKEIMAAKRRIFTRRSSNCSRISSHRDFPSSAGISENTYCFPFD